MTPVDSPLLSLSDHDLIERLIGPTHGVPPLVDLVTFSRDEWTELTQKIGVVRTMRLISAIGLAHKLDEVPHV